MMTTPRFRDLTFVELLGRSWRVSDPMMADDGNWFVSLGLFDAESTMVHAVTGHGATADAARAKAVEMANRWRVMQAEERSREVRE